MNFIFRPYPSHPWIADWSLEPRGCTATYRANSPSHFFRTLETVGRIAPSISNPEWVLQIPVPQNSRINLLFNGLCSIYERKKEHYAAEVLVPEPGILWGRIENIPEVVIATDLKIEEGENFQWLDADSVPALLATKDEFFCLVTKVHLKESALKTAEDYLNRNFEEAIGREFEAREGTQNLFEQMAHHDSLAVISAESLMRSLRPPEGNIPLVWCQSSDTEASRFNIDELLPHALAWNLMDPATAEQLITCALRIQANSGAIPVHFAPHSTNSVLESPKPLLAKTAELIWQTRKNPEFLTTVLPLLRRHIQWMLHHFDPKRKGIHCWKSSAESIVPQLYKSDLATVDLTVLLLTEIEALNRLRNRSELYSKDGDCFEQEREQLEQNLSQMFWNDSASAFTNAYLRDNLESVVGFPAFTPLLWEQLPMMQKSAILERVRESGALPGGLSVLSWRKSAMDDDSFPILQQMLTLQALKQADPGGTLISDFSRMTLQGFVEWHSLCIEENEQLHINPVTAAYIMNVQAIRQYRYHAKGGISGRIFKFMRKVKADRFDLIIIAATLIALFSFRTLYSVLRTPPPLELLETQMQSAYADGNIVETFETCMAIIRYYPDDADQARLLAGNISLLSGKLTDAAELFKEIRQDNPDSPGPMIALGLTYQLQGRFREAEANYYEFCYIFEEIFPELVTEVNHFRQLALEEFKTPPKWKKIYRYRLMHEL